MRGRLAPSPTGALHLGNARSFLLAWLQARKLGAEILLRVEDMESPRIKTGAVSEASWQYPDSDGLFVAMVPDGSCQ